VPYGQLETSRKGISAVTRRADHLRTLAVHEEARAAEAIRAGDVAAAERALGRAQKLRRIAYLRVAAAAYQGDPTLNPAEPVMGDTDEVVRPATLAPDIEASQ
jgi:hypothetical protein